MAGALAHLHQRGVMHGDFYAHNILWDPTSGDAMLSDLGGATLLPDDQPALRRALLALDVRAFGCLLEELVAHAQGAGATASPALDRLAGLATACLHTDPAARPEMGEIASQLDTLAR
jgi:hypothetical protein